MDAIDGVGCLEILERCSSSIVRYLISCWEPKGVRVQVRERDGERGECHGEGVIFDFRLTPKECHDYSLIEFAVQCVCVVFLFV